MTMVFFGPEGSLKMTTNYLTHFDELEQRSSFMNDALAARAELLQTGKGYLASEVHAYLKARVSGNKAIKPKAKSWRE